MAPMKTRMLTLAITEIADTEDPQQLEELIAEAVPGIHVLDHSLITTGDYYLSPTFAGRPAPMDIKQAEALMDENGYLSTVVKVDQAKMFSPVGRLLNHTEEKLDMIHDLAYNFGHSADASIRVVGLENSDLLVLYRTNIAEAIGYAEMSSQDPDLSRLRQALDCQNENG